MRALSRRDLLDYESYGDIREQRRKQAIEHKALRRVQLGRYMSLCFENTETIRHQVQEMIWIDRMVREGSIDALISESNRQLLLGALSATLFIEIDDRAQCLHMLSRHPNVASRVYVETSNATRCYAIVSEEAKADERPAATQFLGFELRGQEPRAVGCDLGEFACHSELNASVVSALLSDLSEPTVGD
jgi:hypothetical protein